MFAGDIYAKARHLQKLLCCWAILSLSLLTKNRGLQPALARSLPTQIPVCSGTFTSLQGRPAVLSLPRSLHLLLKITPPL